jgi:glycosyltransferase involved in cell wall biosynthesis
MKSSVIVITEDGSTDGTDVVAKCLEGMHSRVIHFHSAQKLERGLALKLAWNKLDGDIYAFVDCDLATDMKYFPSNYLIFTFFFISFLLEYMNLVFLSRL